MPVTTKPCLARFRRPVASFCATLCAWTATLAASSVPVCVHAQADDEASVEAAPSNSNEAPAEASTESATTPPEGSVPQAVEHYERGREHYLAGRYREALVELRAALALDQRSPNLVYNVARVNEDLGNLDEAIANYERYLELIPEGESAERDKIQKTIRRLEGARSAAAEDRDDDTGLRGFDARAPQSEPLGRADLLFWATASAGVALVATGGVLGVLALQRENDVGDFVVGPDGTFEDRKDLVSEADTLATASDLTLIGGAAALTTAALLFFLRDPSPDEQEEAATTARIVVNPSAGASVTLRGTF